MHKQEFLSKNAIFQINPNKPIINNFGVPLHDVKLLIKLRNQTNLAQKLPAIKKVPVKNNIEETAEQASIGKLSLFNNLNQNENTKLIFHKVNDAYKLLSLSIRFLVTTATIFTIIFILFNFTAYYDKFQYWYKRNVATPVEADPDNPTTKDILENLLETEEQESISQEKRVYEKEIIQDVQATFDMGTEVVNYAAFEVNPPDYRLVIPKLEKNIPIIRTSPENLISQEWNELEKQIQTDLQGGVVSYPGTALPGQIGNVFITGHSSYYLLASGNYKNVFANLSQLVIGDKVIIYFNSQKYLYQVYDVKVVLPEETNVLNQPDDKSILTLMTCTPTGTALKRLIVTLDQIFPDPKDNKFPSADDGNIIIGADLSA